MRPNDKPFSKEEYNKFDGPAKEVVIEWMRQLGFKDIAINEDEAKRKFAKIWDVCGYTVPNGKQIRIETEVKADWGTVWTADRWKNRKYPFPWPTMDFPYRRRNKTLEHCTHHIVVGGDFRRFFIVPRNVVLESPVEEKWCRNRGGSEPFYRVNLPATNSAWFENENGIWIRR